MGDRVGVISCAHAAWIESSRTMGQSLAAAVGNGAVSTVHTPVDAIGFAACFCEAELLILHTHGDATALYDQRADGRVLPLITMAQLAELPRNPALRFVVATACSLAGGEGDRNFAALISTRISPNGIVVANRGVVYGADTDFCASGGGRSWVAYRNGRLLLDEGAFPISLTMGEAYRIGMMYS